MSALDQALIQGKMDNSGYNNFKLPFFYNFTKPLSLHCRFDNDTRPRSSRNHPVPELFRQKGRICQKPGPHGTDRKAESLIFQRAVTPITPSSMTS